MVTAELSLRSIPSRCSGKINREFGTQSNKLLLDKCYIVTDERV